MKKFRRRIFLVDKKFQLKYTGLILIFMFIVAWIAGHTVYHTGWLLMGEKLSNVYPQGRLVMMMRTINMTLLLRTCLLIPVVILVSIFLSHRIAGPLFNIERFMKGIAKGDLSKKLILRKNDELKDLAKTINEMVDDLRGRTKDMKRLTNICKLETEKLKHSINNEKPGAGSIGNNIGELEKSIRDLDDHLSQYRLETVED
ncbi:MAG: methyl-accepting chemotaxis protein [Candidatus Omnitrophota bacterium]